MKILVSGGHLTPALAFIDYIQKKTADSIVFVGRKYSQDQAKQHSQEETEVTARNVPFVSFDSAVRFRANESLFAKIFRPFRFMRSIGQALSIMRAQKPDVFLTFGGYLAAPLAIAAKLLSIPIVTHEQTRTAGFANQFIGFLAKRVAVTFPESQRHFPAHKTVVTGNPVRQEILLHGTKQPIWIDKKLTKPLLLITCGNQGSHAINMVVTQALPEITKDWVVVHLVGNPTKDVDYAHELTVLKQQLPPEQRHNYFLRTWTNGSDLAWLYTHATAAVARSGANTVQELVAREIPTLFIPLPFSHRNEQTLNAQALVDDKAAMLLEQSQLKADTLISKLEDLQKNHTTMRNRLAQHAVPTDGDHRLYQLVAAAGYAQ